MRGGSRRKGARDAGTRSPRARVGSPALCVPTPGRRVHTCCRAVGEGSGVSVSFPAETWPAGGWWESVPWGCAWSSQDPAPVASPGGSELVWLPRQGRVGPPRPGDVSGQQRESLIGSCVL